MLSQNQLVAVRAAIESTYTGTCTIVEYQEYTKPNHSTGHHEVDVLTNQSCRLSFEKITNTDQTETASALIQITKLFIAPEILINPGSKITVTQNGITTEYQQSGKAAVYATHQEIMLELFEGWA